MGYIGYRQAQPILVDCLRKLEYRGYDSCGIALLNKDIHVFKDVGRIGELVKTMPSNGGRIGIGHTRWATHGFPTKMNAHPHADCHDRIMVVHNGIINNFLSLREQLTQEGHRFRSETDTEVIPHLIEKYYRGNFEEAVAQALCDVRGSYAVIALHKDHQELVLARRESPLLVGLGDAETFVASDAPPLLEYTDRVVYLEDDDIAVLSSHGMKVSNGGKEVDREEHHLTWTVDDARKAGYPHFMLKEIHEQPKVIQDTLGETLSSVDPGVDLGIELGSNIQSILLLACGTSYYAALVGKHVLENMARIPARVEIASEFTRSQVMVGKTLAIAITQSGETADTNRALKKAKESGCRTLAVTNVLGSSVTRIADQTFYTKAGPEISVAATKTFNAQLIALYLIALSLSPLDAGSCRQFANELKLLPVKVQRVLDVEDHIARHGRYLANYENVFYVARGINYPVALEGALKLKEISYIHAEGYAAGELKHGPFALLSKNVPVVAVFMRDGFYDALLSNIKEIKARESPVVAIVEEGDRELRQYVDHVIEVPRTDPLLSPVVTSVALQLLAYYAARERGCPIDMPRNLAKSVTVE